MDKFHFLAPKYRIDICHTQVHRILVCTEKFSLVIRDTVFFIKLLRFIFSTIRIEKYNPKISPASCVNFDILS